MGGSGRYPVVPDRPMAWRRPAYHIEDDFSLQGQQEMRIGGFGNGPGVVRVELKYVDLGGLLDARVLATKRLASTGKR